MRLCRRLCPGARFSCLLRLSTLEIDVFTAKEPPRSSRRAPSYIFSLAGRTLKGQCDTMLAHVHACLDSRCLSLWTGMGKSTNTLSLLLSLSLSLSLFLSLPFSLSLLLSKFPAKKWGDTETVERGRSVLVMRARYRSDGLTPHQRGWMDAG